MSQGEVALETLSEATGTSWWLASSGFREKDLSSAFESPWRAIDTASVRHSRSRPSRARAFSSGATYMAKVTQGEKQLDPAGIPASAGEQWLHSAASRNNPQHRMPGAAHRKLKSAFLMLLTSATQPANDCISYTEAVFSATF